MAGIARISSNTTGHGCWPTTIIAQGCISIVVEGLPASTIGHIAIPHVCTKKPFPMHPLVIAQGSTNIIAEGAPIARIGDRMSCSDMIAVGAVSVLGGG